MRGGTKIDSVLVFIYIELMSSDRFGEWRLVEDRFVQKYYMCDVCERTACLPDGRQVDFFIIKTGDWVQALALTPQNEIVCVRQFRIGVWEMLLEFPGGLVEAGEDPIAGAERELREETGYVGHNPILLGQCYPNPAFQSNRLHYVLFTGCEHTSDTHWDEYEEMTTHLVPLKDLDALIDRDEFRHGLTFGGILFLRRYLSNCPFPENR
jgi:8-oxo-dGTP pyrophosphatase MutT (NUDIX family)